MAPPDLYGPGPRGMGMGPGNPDGRGPMPHVMPPMDRGYGGPRQRDHPRAMPPYMGYPGPRSYDDFNVRPQRGPKNRRGPPPQMEPYRRPMDHNMYMYPPHGYDQMGYHYGMEPYHGGPDRRGYQGPAPGEPMRYNADPPQMGFRGDRGERPHMRPGQGGERGGRPGGPPDQRDVRGGDGRGEPRGDPRDGRGPRDYAGPPRDDDGRGPAPRGPTGGPGAPPMRPRQGGPGGPPMRDDDRHRAHHDPSGPGPSHMRGGRGMRGSRGSGIRGGSDRAEMMGHHADMGGEPIRRNESRGGRGRGDGGPSGPGGHGHSDGPERRGGRGTDEAGKSH